MRVYVAGAYSADNVVGILNNMNKGIRLSTQVLLKGFSPFCPWLDFQFQLNLREDETLTVDDYYRYSIDWLKVSDAVLLVPGWENSGGTLEEIRIANELSIPIFETFEELENYRSEMFT